MCGRFSVDDQDPGLDDAYQLLVGCPFPGVANLNTAPTETAWIVRVDSSAGGSLTALEAKWSLTPYWSEAATPKYATFNARAETLATSRTFREPFRRRRCVVPVSGYYEWRKQAQPGLFEDGGRAARSLAGSLAGSVKGGVQPYFVRPRRGALLLAGVWDRWRRGRAAVDSFAVVTTAASDQLAFLHPRQPLSLAPQDARVWLRAERDSGELARLLAPRLPVELLAAPVSRHVGNARNKDRRCSAPVGAPTVIAPDP